jgi:hypothetical protein
MAVPMDQGPVVRGVPPGVLNAAIGVWLVISIFIWEHAPAQRTNAWLCGVLCVIFALAGIAAPRVRRLNTVLAVWLFISPWALPSGGTMSSPTAWITVLSAIGIFIVSLIPPETRISTGMLR